MLFARVFVVLQSQHGKNTLPCAETHRLADPLVAFLSHLIVSAYLSGSVGGGVNNAGGASANCSGVFCPNGIGAVMWRTMLVVDTTLGEVSESIFGIGQLAQREGKSRHGELPIEMVVAGRAHSAEYV